MRIRKCNFCDRILDDKKDKYYSIGEIECHAPDNKTIRIITDNTGEVKHQSIQTESWLNYCDLDFCEDCWEQVDIQRFL